MPTLQQRSLIFVTIVVCLIALFFINQYIKINSQTITLNEKKNFDVIIEKHKKTLGLRDIIISIMNSQTGEILYLNNQDLAISNPSGPSSVMQPIVIALGLNLKKISINDKFSAYNNGKQNAKGEYPIGAYPFGKFKIIDNNPLTVNIFGIQDIIKYKSYIGTLQIANKMNAKEYVDGINSFGIGIKINPSNKNESSGNFPSLMQMQSGERDTGNIFKMASSFAQYTATHLQLIKAFCKEFFTTISLTKFKQNKTK